MRLRILPAALLAGLTLLLAAHSPTRDHDTPEVSASLLPAAPMRVARAAHTATLLQDGTVLITGGFAQDREGHPFSEAEIFDPASETFESTGSMVTGRQSHTASLLPDGRVLIAGGFGRDAIGSTEIYNPASHRFERGPDLVSGRASHRATVLPDGRIMMSGGLNASGAVMASIEIFDPATGRFNDAGALTTPRLSHTQTLLTDGTVLVIGGTSGRRAETQILRSTEIFDPATGESTVVADMRTPRYKHAAVSLADGRVLVIAGSDERDWKGHYDTAEIFDPETGAFSETEKLNRARFKLRTAAVRLNDGRVLVAGGAKTVEVFDPSRNRFDAVEGNLDSPWYFATATALADGRALIAGGYDRRIQSTRQSWIFTP